MKNKIGKTAMLWLFAICMIVPLVFIAMTVNAADGNYEMVHYTAAQAKKYLDGNKTDCPADVEGYLFAGWYRNENHKDIKNAIVSGSDVPSEGAYALYVPEQVLGVKAQVSRNLTDRDPDNDGKGAIRFVTSVDSLNYRDAGFFFSFEGSAGEVKRSNHKVSTKLFGIYEDSINREEVLTEYVPSTSFHVLSKYFKTHTFVNVPKSQFGLKITVVPFWETLDGTIVRGKPVTKSVNDGRGTGSYAVTSYEELKAVLAEVEAKNMTGEVTIKVAGNFAIPETVTISAGRNIVFIDDGTTRTLSRAQNFQGNMFQTGTKATLTIKSTGTETESKLIFDGANVAATASAIYAAADSRSHIHILAGVEFRNYKSTANGAVIRLDAKSGTILASDGVRFENNSSTGKNTSGAALYIRGGNTVTVSHTAFYKNTAGSGSAIAIVNTTDDAANANIQIDKCTFSQNKAVGAGGWLDAAVFIQNIKDFVISDSIFTGNTGSLSAGAVQIITDAKSKIASVGKISNSTFDENLGIRGGAIFNCQAKLTIEECSFTNNQVPKTFSEKSGIGGAINNECRENPAEELIVTNSTFAGNMAARGGAIHNQAGTLTLQGTSERALFQDNTATENGGAIYLQGGILNGSGYVFAGNSTEVIYVGSGATNNYKEYMVKTFAQLQSAVAEIADLKMKNAVCIKVADSFVFTGTITIPTGCHIVIEDDGMGIARTFTKTKAANMFVMTENATLTFRSSGTVDEPKLIIDGNYVSATGYAAMIYARDILECNINILDGVQFKNNIQKGNGSVIYFNKGNSSRVYIDGARFENNTAAERAGGVMCLTKASVEIKNAVFRNNKARYGGAIESNGKVNITNCKFESNQSVKSTETLKPEDPVGGGVIYAWNSAECTIADCEFVENTTAYSGGVIRSSGKLNLTGTDVMKAVFKNNVAAEKGGAIYLGGGLLAGRGYAFTGNAPDHIYVESGTNNYEEYVVKTYQELKKAVAAIGKLETKEIASIKVADSFDFTDTITIPEGCNIAVIDDGTARTITRGARFKSGNMFEMGTGATLTLRSTGTVNEPKLIFDGNKANVTATGSTVYAAANSRVTVNILEGVKAVNHKTTGNGAVICLASNSHATLNIKGAVFEKNETSTASGTAYGKHGGVLKVHDSEVVIEDSVFAENTAAQASAIFAQLCTVTIRGCDIHNNIAQNGGWSDAAVWIERCQNSAIDDSSFTRNSGNKTTGAIIVTGSNLVISNSTFADNTGVKGAAILNTGASTGNSTLVIDGCTFTNNTATEQGGAICSEEHQTPTIGSSLTIRNSVFTENQAYRGGAICNIANLTLEGTGEKALFQGNTASNWGGAVYTEGGTFYADGYIFEENSATHGGAIYMNSISTVKDTTFKRNHADVGEKAEGGAIYVQNTATFENCTFDGNGANMDGGAILINANGKTITLAGTNKAKAVFRNNQVNNETGVGGAVYVYEGTLEGSGYKFTNNSPDNISVRGISNYKDVGETGEDLPYQFTDEAFLSMENYIDYIPKIGLSGVKEDGQYFSLPGKDGFICMQGGCTDGEYMYLAMEKTDAESGLRTHIIYKVKIDTWKIEAQSDILELDHANSITYNSEQKCLVVAHAGGAANKISFVDPETLQITGQRTLDYNIYGLVYNPERKRYVAGFVGSPDFAILSSDFKIEKRYKGHNIGLGNQSIETDKNYIYIGNSGAGQKANMEIVKVYDWNGVYQGVFRWDTVSEHEAIISCNGVQYVTFFIGSSGGRVYKAKNSFDDLLLKISKWY